MAGSSSFLVASSSSLSRSRLKTPAWKDWLCRAREKQNKLSLVNAYVSMCIYIWHFVFYLYIYVFMHINIYNIHIYIVIYILCIIYRAYMQLCNHRIPHQTSTPKECSPHRFALVLRFAWKALPSISCVDCLCFTRAFLILSTHTKNVTVLGRKEEKLRTESKCFSGKVVSNGNIWRNQVYDSLRRKMDHEWNHFFIYIFTI